MPFLVDKDCNSVKAFLAVLKYLISQVHVKLLELIYAGSGVTWLLSNKELNYFLSE